MERGLPDFGEQVRWLTRVRFRIEEILGSLFSSEQALPHPALPVQDSYGDGIYVRCINRVDVRCLVNPFLLRSERGLHGCPCPGWERSVEIIEPLEGLPPPLIELLGKHFQVLGCRGKCRVCKLQLPMTLKTIHNIETVEIQTDASM